MKKEECNGIEFEENRDEKKEEKNEPGEKAEERHVQDVHTVIRNTYRQG